MKFYSKDSNPIAKATVAVLHDTRSAFDCELFRAKEYAKGHPNEARICAEIEKARKKINGVVDMLFNAVKEHPEFPAPNHE